MAEKILIMGESGTGKSTSMRNCDPSKIALVNPVGKPLPFRAKFDSLDGVTDSRKICQFMRDQVKAGKKIIVVDDFQYILSIPYMNRIKEAGWDKWNDFGANYFEIIDICKELPSDVIVYYLTHCETLDSGTTTVKLIGKMLREKITIEGLFTIVLRTSVQDGQYYFLTQNSGKDTVKSPIGMFSSYAIDNDLNYVDEKVRNYYSIGECLTDEEIKEIDALAEKVDIIKPDADGRKRRSGRKTEQNVQESEQNVQKPEPVRKRREKAPELTAPANDEPAIDMSQMTDFEGNPTGQTVEEFVKGEPEPQDPPQRKRREAVAAPQVAPEPVFEPAPDAPAEAPRRRRRRE